MWGKTNSPASSVDPARHVVSNGVKHLYAGYHYTACPEFSFHLLLSFVHAAIHPLCVVSLCVIP